jgi:dTDP-4-amino-4,6-dideoxygalactose transaminase
MPSPIPFLNLYASNRPVETAFFRELRKLYRKSAFIGGPYVEAFEKSFARACGAKHCVAVSNGTAALHLSLAAAGVGAGDDVIVPAFTFPGAAGPVLQRGARVVFADVRPEDGCLDPRAVARAVTPKTKAVLVTHLFGHPANLDGLRKALKGKGARRILFIEDAAQAHGGSHRAAPLGSLGDFGCFSFYPTKNLGGMGDAGAILVKSAAAAARLRRLRDHGQTQRFHPEEAGFNARMDALQALFLSLKLPRLGRDNARRASIAAGFLKALDGSGTLRALVPSADGVSAWHAFVVAVSGETRAAFLRHLDAAGIGHQIYYPRALPALKAFKAFAVTCPAAEDLARRVVALPLHPGLDAAQQARIRAALASFRPSSRIGTP